jgi:uncharacterized damage-inducible protein DinB
MNLQEFFLKQKEAVRQRTRQVAGMVRPDQMGWRPEAGALSAGQLLRHIWVSEQGARKTALEGDFSYYETRIPKGLDAVLGRIGTVEEEMANLERVHRATLEAARAFPLERWDEERVHEELDIRRKVCVILLGITEHEIHHRAQLMTYLRILGTPVPQAFRRR